MKPGNPSTFNRPHKFAPTNRLGKKQATRANHGCPSAAASSHWLTSKTGLTLDARAKAKTRWAISMQIHARSLDAVMPLNPMYWLNSLNRMRLWPKRTRCCLPYPASLAPTTTLTLWKPFLLTSHRHLAGAKNGYNSNYEFDTTTHRESAWRAVAK